MLTATSMESNGVPGEVCVSESVLKYFEGEPDFAFRKHKTVELKGKKGAERETIDSYLLLRD